MLRGSRPIGRVSGLKIRKVTVRVCPTPPKIMGYTHTFHPGWQTIVMIALALFFFAQLVIIAVLWLKGSPYISKRA